MRPKNFPTGFLRRFTFVHIAIIILSAAQAANGAKILFFTGWGSHSHRVAMQPLATKLAENGHQVTFLTPLSPEVKNPNITEFCPKALKDFNVAFDNQYSNQPVLDKINDRDSNLFVDNFGSLLWDITSASNEITLKSPDFAGWLEKADFDLVIFEHPRFEIALGIAYKCRAKYIGFSPMVFWAQEADTLGIPSESSWYDSWTLGSFYKFIPARFHREYNALGWYSYYRSNYLPKVDAVLQEVIDKNIPPVEELIRKMSLAFVNTHFSNDYAKSLPPFVVPVGGMHVQDPKLAKPLPKALADFIKSGKEGFVYISYGTLVRMTGLPPKTRASIFDSIAKFPNARFLIKWNTDIPKDLPSNVFAMKWFPQQDLLAHPDCRGFISHGGLMSVQQAEGHGVPVVITPVFGDQPYNARAAAHHGGGIYLELADITLESFSDVLSQLLYNETLAASAKELARRFKDRPMSALDTAVWWTEYVLRHNDTSHLKPLGINQNWWQRRQLDFWAVVFLGIYLCLTIVLLVIYKIVRFFRKSPEKVKQQ